MSEPYTYEQAKQDTEGSTDLELARTVSLIKWRQIASGDSTSYKKYHPCGYCFIIDLCYGCPARAICNSCSDRPPAETIQMLTDLKHPKEVSL